MPSIRLQDFFPPLLWKAGAGVRARLFRPTHSGGRTFSSYAEAAARCEGFGYETGQLVELIFRKTEIYRTLCRDAGPPPIGLPEALLLSAVAFGTARDPEVLRVLDFGGACGAHYFLVRSVFPKVPRLDWRVVETQAMVGRAATLANKELRFFSSIDASGAAGADGVDVVYSSSTLQYTPEPEGLLESLLALKPRVLGLTRLALTTGNSKRIEVQESRLADNGPGPIPPGMNVGDKRTRYPVTFLPQALLESRLLHDFVLPVNVSDASVFGSGREGLTGRAYLARLK